MKLSDFGDDGTGYPILSRASKKIPMVLSSSNIDDCFSVLFELDIKEIEVNKREMVYIVAFYLANIGKDKDGNQGKVLMENKIDRFMGVNLILV